VLGIKHCYIETHDSSGNRSTRGLVGGWYLGMDGCGQVLPDNDYDRGGSCGEWNQDCTTDQCVKDHTDMYPNPSRYSYLGADPNSNSFASNIANACKLKRPPIPEGDTPGWGNRNSPVPFPNVPQIGTPRWPITCPAPITPAPMDGG